MDDGLTLEDFKKIIGKISRTLDDNSSYLSELDSEIGDGDHGTTISRGFRAVEDKIGQEPGGSIPGLLKSVGFTLMNTMGGVSGPIFGSIFTAMAKNSEGKDTISLKDLSDMLADSLSKVKELGGAGVGDKTLVDSLEPAVRSLQDSSSKDLALKEALILAERAALEGAESTRDMIAKKGRSRYVGERSLGHQDAGATTLYLIIKSINDSL